MKWASKIYLENSSFQVASVESRPTQSYINDVDELEEEEIEDNIAQGRNSNIAGKTEDGKDGGKGLITRDVKEKKKKTDV